MASNEEDSFKRVEEKKGTKRHAPSDSKGHKSRHRNPNSGSGGNHFIKVENVDNMQIGNNNKMYVNFNNSRPYTRSQAQQSCTKSTELTEEQSSRLRQLQDCSDEVDENMMADLSKFWDRSWFKYGIMLLSDACLKNIQDSFKDNRREISYQVLRTWKEKTDDPSVKNLISLLTSSGDYSSILSLLKE